MTSEYMYPMQDHLLELLFDNSKSVCDYYQSSRTDAFVLSIDRFD